jgi:two-component system sensor histidine kinase PilS (NtrC family)
VRDILSISRRDEIDPDDIELASWLARSVEQYGDGFPERRDRFDASGVPEDLLIEFDPSHLQQALFNLWDNSFQHGGPDVRIDLTGGWLGAGRQPYLDMHDNGIGIGIELRDRIFEPFFTTHHNGSGLGLYLSRELCDYNRARLELIDGENPSSSGARFRIIFTAPEAV